MIWGEATADNSRGFLQAEIRKRSEHKIAYTGHVKLLESGV